MNFENERVFVERWSIDRLIPYARNARTHSNAQVAQIAASIAEFGFNNPVLVDADGGIIAGHGRVLAARKLSLAEVPVIILRHLNQNQKRAFALADNKIALNAGWDEEMLRLELQALADQDLALALTGFDEHELQHLLESASVDQLPEPDDVPEPDEEAVSIPEICGFWASIACCAGMERGPRISRVYWTAELATWCLPICPTTWIMRARRRGS